MELTTSALQSEIDKIISDGEKKVHTDWTVEFTIRDDCPITLSDAPDDASYVPQREKTEKVYVPIVVKNIDFVGDYEAGFADEVTLVCEIASGQWAKVLYPCRNYLFATLVKTHLKEVTLETDMDEDKESEKYVCIPKLTPELAVDGKRVTRMSRRELDLKGMVTVEFQLLDLSTEKIRAATTGGVWRRAKPGDVNKGILAKESEKITIEDGKAIEYIDIKEPNNKEEREHYVLPQGTLLTEVAHLIHRRCGGVYTAGINAYMRNKAWYVYPLYDTTVFSRETKTLTIIKIPEYKYTNAERTYRVDGDKLYILGSSDAEFSDSRESKHLAEGNGVRFADARLFMNDLVETKDNKAIASRKKVNHEYTDEKRDKRNVVYVSSDRINANPFEEYTKLARRQGAVYVFEWERADSSLLYPGMPVKIMFADGDDIGEIEGVLLKSHVAIQLQGQATTAGSHKTTTVLAIFCKVNEES